MVKTFDFIVIGGGSGGIASARRAAQYGATVLVIESGPLGGTCVNVGCVPKKVMWTTSQISETLDLAVDYGFHIKRLDFDWAYLKSARDNYVSRLNGIYQRNLDSSGVTLIHGRARFNSSHSVMVNGDEYHANHILIATGGMPSVPDIPGAHLGITSDGFFELDHQPENLLVIGAGYIATELAGLMHGLGSKVSMLLRKDKLLRTFDHDAHKLVMDQMQQSGIEIITNIALQSLVNDNGYLGYRDKNGDGRDGFDCIIWAIGRHTNIADLNLDVTGIKVSQKGYVETDEYQNTSVQGVYAVGDVTHRAQLTPVAIAAGRKLSNRLFNDQQDSRLDYNNIPTVIFSHPPVGTVGLSETEAIEKYGEHTIKIYKSTFVDMHYAISNNRPRTLVKLIVQGDDEKVVGCHVVGHSADEMIQGFAVALKMGATKRDFDETVAIHPTAAEELVTLT
jgi:glutathione reductase (NADPH)